MAIERIDRELCMGCSLCVEYSCPTDVIRMNYKEMKAYIAHPQDCHVCSLCEMDCPVGAIYVSPEYSRQMYLPY